ncbi:MAG: hypothetical protein ACLTSZ_17030 [Lachnospiraceae bacterium]
MTFAIYDTVYGPRMVREASPVEDNKESWAGRGDVCCCFQAAIGSHKDSRRQPRTFCRMRMCGTICIGAQILQVLAGGRMQHGMQTYMAECATIDSLIEKLEEVQSPGETPKIPF